MIDVISSAVLAGARHGFFGRRGGVSTGIAAGLNVGLGSGDDPQAIAENRRRATDVILSGGTLVTVYQIHSAEVVEADIWTDDARPHADAIVTDRPGLVLGILTADCAPVLLADIEAGVVGAAHAGWKGALSGVTDATIAAMEKLGAARSRIAAAIGPCIAQRSYEVDAAFRARFETDDPGNGCFFKDCPRADHPHFDLEGYVAHRLAIAGIGWIDALGFDTYADKTRFFSFRRATHRDEPDYGRQISLIGLTS